MKDSPRQQFRWAPHVAGVASLKPKDYEQRGEIEGLNEYDAWKTARIGRCAEVGDLLESGDGQLRICKYVGFEPAQWALPEAKAACRARDREPARHLGDLMREHRLGDDIDDFCIRCKRITNHVIVSVVSAEPAKVRCRTCHSDHDFRREQAPPPKIDLRKQALFNEVLKTVDPTAEPVTDDDDVLAEEITDEDILVDAAVAEPIPEIVAPPKAKAKGKARK